MYLKVSIKNCPSSSRTFLPHLLDQYELGRKEICCCISPGVQYGRQIQRTYTEWQACSSVSKSKMHILWIRTITNRPSMSFTWRIHKEFTWIPNIAWSIFTEGCQCAHGREVRLNRMLFYLYPLIVGYEHATNARWFANPNRAWGHSPCKWNTLKKIKLNTCIWVGMCLVLPPRKACVYKRLNCELKYGNHSRLNSKHNWGTSIWPFNEHKNLHSSNAWDIHMNSKNYEESGYGLDLELLR